jgi:multidrug efflux pump subunit AcrB
MVNTVSTCPSQITTSSRSKPGRFTPSPDMARSALSFNLGPGTALSQAVDAIAALKTQLHVPATLHGALAGTAQAFQASLSSTPLIVAAIFIIYGVIGMLYESFIHPITILSALPSAGVGALLMLFPYDLTLLSPHRHRQKERDHDRLSARNGETRGASPTEAIHQACPLRFRPIMTTPCVRSSPAYRRRWAKAPARSPSALLA